MKHKIRILLSILVALSLLFSSTGVFAFTAIQMPPQTSPETIVARGYVTYEDFGAVGNGVANDFAAIYWAHEFANAHDLPVRARVGARYYIGRTDNLGLPYNNPCVKTTPGAVAIIQTNTDWTGAEFIIDDSVVTTVAGSAAYRPIFLVASRLPMVDLTGNISGLQRGQTHVNFGVTLEHDSVVFVRDENIRRFRRDGTGTGHPQQDFFIVDRHGNVDPNGPIIWNFNRFDEITARPIDPETLYLTGGLFTTISNRLVAPNNNGYIARGIRIMRSNTVVDGLQRNVTNEAAFTTNNNNQPAAYAGIIVIYRASNVTVKNSEFWGHIRARHGTYDLQAEFAMNTSIINSRQVNPGGITDTNRWGVMGGNYLKNFTFDNVYFSRFDAHTGLVNLTIRNSDIGHSGILAVGFGTMLIENTHVRNRADFIGFRTDFGNFWDGDIIIRNSQFTPSGGQRIVAFNNSTRDYGIVIPRAANTYPLPNIIIDGLHVSGTGAVTILSGTGTNTATTNSRAPEFMSVRGLNRATFTRFANVRAGTEISHNDYSPMIVMDGHGTQAARAGTIINNVVPNMGQPFDHWEFFAPVENANNTIGYNHASHNTSTTVEFANDTNAGTRNVSFRMPSTALRMVPVQQPNPGPAATCTTPQTCLDCDFVYVEALGHTPGSAATCTTPQTCIRCDYIFAPALEHSWSDWATTLAPTCVDYGEQTRQCSSCRETEMQVLNPLGHIPGPGATCTMPQTCIRCNYVFNNATNHTWSEWITTLAPTCIDYGEQQRQCTTCETSEIQVLNSLGHNAGAAATCTTPQTCTRCEYMLNPATGHNWSAWQTRNPADCATREVQFRTCANCQAEESHCVGEYAHMPGGWAIITHPTCSTTGVTIQRCMLCNIVLHTLDIAIDPAAHVMGNWVIVTPVTCTAAGLEMRICSLCGEAEETRAIAPVDCIDTSGNGRCDFCNTVLARRMIFTTRWESNFFNWLLFFLGFGWIWMWF